ncbi:TerB family tellurite resistance protein [Streptomyces litchfieldiae]|uniref:TerB family tellurite resistance protein n=1 Tax=Streptomyces litchfieldiae TaxID=3075543 RepID=A0ABU2MVZ6_9ACTN|nr:TerB family tellurite resistance protein [Streptomyces sp. DSM 44938]MDT0345269.1 TerB family tellurite resistance protein [Streptomyces sp. DSM 44938]
MVHSRLAGVRTVWRVEDDGDFFCAACGGDRCYQRLGGRRRLTVLGLPVLPRGAAEPVVQCVSCRGRFPLGALDRPTTTRLTALLRDGVHTIALALLAAGGGDSPVARRTAVEVVRSAGFTDCTEERLLTLQAALGAGSLPALDREVRDTLAALTPHLAAPGRESLLLRGARIALADGPYHAGERAMLTAVGEALHLPPADTERLLAEALSA